jgi:hypothetical protein
MSTTVQSSAKPTSRSSAQGVLRLTRDEVQVLQYYRDLSDTDRVATRCLLQVLQRPRPELARQAQPAPSTEA